MKEQNKNQKVVLFPGMVERMLTQAVTAMENQRYNDAIEHFEQLFAFYDGDEYSLSVYVHCLYEVKDYARAKEACETLISFEPDNYFEVMELYLTICMQLKHFMQVEKIIHSMLERNLIPEEEIEKFQRIQRLNEEIAEKKQRLDDQVSQTSRDYFEELELAHFLQKSNFEKLTLIQELSTLNVRPYAQQLLEIAELEDFHPFLKSLLLIMLVEQQIVADVKIKKLGYEKVVQLHELPLPTKLAQFDYVQNQLLMHFEDNPSYAQLVYDMLVKHAIVAYPFEWNSFDLDEVVYMYKDLIQQMFGEPKTFNNETLIQYVEMLDRLSELEEI